MVVDECVEWRRLVDSQGIPRTATAATVREHFRANTKLAVHADLTWAACAGCLVG